MDSLATTSSLALQLVCMVSLQGTKGSIYAFSTKSLHTQLYILFILTLAGAWARVTPFFYAWLNCLWNDCAARNLTLVVQRFYLLSTVSEDDDDELSSGDVGMGRRGEGR